MLMRLRTTISAIVFMLLILSTAFAADTIRCTECGMKVDITSKFSAKTTQGDATLYFCDIGDLFTYLIGKRPQNVRALVKDYQTGEWLDAHQAFYVHDGKKFISPMGWGIAAFRDRKDAAGFGSVMDFDGALQAVK